MIKVSIIVPVYKVEKYIEKCVRSLLDQTLDEIEIILVDDGSPDKCGVICDEYERKCSNVVVIHQQNQGLSMARNNAIKMARGEYLGFVDGDDYVHKEMFKYLYNNCKKNNAEIGVCNYRLVDEKGNVIEQTEMKPDEILTCDETLQRILFKKYDIHVISCNKIFKRELFKDIMYPKNKLFEDYTTIIKVIERANKIYRTYNDFYYYVQRDGSINHENFRKIEFNKKSLDLVEAVNEIEELVYNKHPEIYNSFIVGCIENKMGVANQMIKCNYKDKEFVNDMKREIKLNKRNILKNKYLSFKDKYKIVLYRYQFIYKLIYKMYLKNK